VSASPTAAVIGASSGIAAANEDYLLGHERERKAGADRALAAGYIPAIAPPA
jgi:hypothetical protein